MKSNAIKLLILLVICFPSLSSAIDVNEDFTAGYGGFGYFTPEYWGVTVSDGRLKFRRADIQDQDPDSTWIYQAWIDPLSPTKTFYPSQALSYYFDAFEISVDAYWDGGANNYGYGLYVCMQGSDSSIDAIVFQVSGNGYYGVWSVKASVWTSIVPWTQSSYIAGAQQKNTLSLLKEGANFTFSINGQVVSEKTIGSETAFAGGGVGLCASAEVDASFDNFALVESVVQGSEKVQYSENGHFYQRIDSEKTWGNAKSYCESAGGHLVTFTSKDEEDFVKDKLLKVSDGGHWMGGTDEANEGSWKWITGETWGYTNWQDGKPDNYGVGEDYLIIKNPLGPWVWDDGGAPRSPYSEKPFICEWSQSGSTYKITASAGSGGRISPAGIVTVNFGAKPIFTITADSGYVIYEVKVNGKDIGPVNSDTEVYTFDPVTQDCAIVASFTQSHACTNVFMNARCFEKNRVDGGVCLIYGENSKGEKRSLGTGVLVSKDLVLTAFHIFEPADWNKDWNRTQIAENAICFFGVEYESCNNMSNISNSLQEIKVKRILADGNGEKVNFIRKGDWSLIQLESTVKDYAYNELSAHVDPNEDIVIYGFPFGKYPEGTTVAKEIACGKIVDDSYWLASSYLQHDCNTFVGNSGGPVINKSGEVVGIVSGTSPINEEYACKVDSFYSFIKPYLTATNDTIIFRDMTFPKGSKYEFASNGTLIIGQNVIFESGSNITFKAPTVKAQSGFRAKEGAVVIIKQQ